MIRVAFNTSPLTSPHAGRGTGTYTRNLLQSLLSVPDIVVTQFTDRVPQNVDLIHYPFFDPFLLTLPRFRSVPRVVTVHDLIPLVYPSHFPRGFRGEIKWQIQHFLLRGVERILTDSIASKTDIHRIVPYPEDRIDVVYLAPQEQFQRQSNEETLRVREKYNLPKQYCLYVGDINWNKNIPGMIRALAPIALPLVLVGKAFTRKDTPEILEINSVIEEERMNGKIYRLGFVPEEDLPGIYACATVTIVPSFVEGFGLPVLEAMACGCPVAVSNTSSLTEISGPSISFDPRKNESIRDAVRTIIEGDRRQLTKDYEDWVKRFSWEKAAKETVEAYKKVSLK